MAFVGMGMELLEPKQSCQLSGHNWSWWMFYDAWKKHTFCCRWVEYFVYVSWALLADCVQIFYTLLTFCLVVHHLLRTGTYNFLNSADLSVSYLSTISFCFIVFRLCCFMSTHLDHSLTHVHISNILPSIQYRLSVTSPWMTSQVKH